MDKRIQQLLNKKDFEIMYHSLYLQNPEMYRQVRFRNWQEFTAEYLATGKERMRLPESAPTPVIETLSEKAFFLDDAREVCLVMNARYCPPFWHDHDFIKIMYVLNGSFYFYTSRDKRIRITRGNILIVPPGTEQSVFSDGWEDCVVNIFLRIGTFEKAFSSLLSDSSLLSGYFWNMLYGKDISSVIWIQSDGNERLDGFILDMLDAEFEGRENINFFLVSFVMAFLASATSDYRDQIRSIHGTQINIGRLPMMIQFIRKNYNTVTLDDLAEHFGKSREYICTYIRQQTGYTLTQLLKKYRLRQAAIMLRDSEMSIEEIMFRVGYTDISYFYKIFRQRYNLTPGQYREQDRIISI